MDLVTNANILNKKMFPNFLSTDHVLYFPEAVGVIQALGRDDPNVNDYERMGSGVDGISYKESTFKDQPWDMEIEYNEAIINRFIAIVLNQNPDDAEQEDSSGIDLVMAGGSFGLVIDLDIVINQTDRANVNYVKSQIILLSEQNKTPTEIPNEGSSKVSLSGVASRQFDANKPACMEGWGHVGTIAEQTVPDDTVSCTATPFWLARDPAAYAGSPRKAYYKGGTPIAAAVIGSVAANDRYTAIVVYETSKGGYTDLAFTTVDGAENVAPVKVTDAAIEVAVDAIVADARWCRVADILVTEVGAVVINTADINMPILPANTYTFYNTAVAPTAQHKADGWFIYDYVIALKKNGVHKRDTTGIASQTATTIVFSTAADATAMFEVIYWAEPMAKWNQLQA